MTKAAAKDPAEGALKVAGEAGKSKERLLTDNSLAASTTSMAAAMPYAKNVFGGGDANELAASIREKIVAVRNGSMDGPEALLVGQANSLNLIYTELTRRAALNMGEYIHAAERYMRLALKAQAQCRATIETLAALKNPPVVYARQANISSGHQQINNHPPQDGPPPAEKIQTAQNELLEDQNGQRLDLGATGAAARSDTAVEAMATFDRAIERGRQASLEQKR